MRLSFARHEYKHEVNLQTKMREIQVPSYMRKTKRPMEFTCQDCFLFSLISSHFSVAGLNRIAFLKI